MSELPIPPEAVEAAARAAYDSWQTQRNWSVPAWDKLDEEFRERSRKEARAAFLAMLEAWPGMHQFALPDNRGTFSALILPLTQEKTDDKV